MPPLGLFLVIAACAVELYAVKIGAEANVPTASQSNRRNRYCAVLLYATGVDVPPPNTPKLVVSAVNTYR
jgi:uncharacterized membrane protein